MKAAARWTVLALVSMSGSALAGSPAPSAALPSYRIHLFVSDEMDVDSVRSLARPGAVLWLRTRTNMLRASMVETLGRFEESYVQLRVPLLRAHASQLEGAGAAGIWIDVDEAASPAWNRLAGRPLAIEIQGDLTDARLFGLSTLRPRWTQWGPSSAPDLDRWGRWVQLPGRKLLDARSWGSAPPCLPIEGKGAGRRAALRVSLDIALGAAFSSCSTAVRIRVDERATAADVIRALMLHPEGELEAEIGSDERALRRIRALLDRLDAASKPRPGSAAQ